MFAFGWGRFIGDHSIHVKIATVPPIDMLESRARRTRHGKVRISEV